VTLLLVHLLIRFIETVHSRVLMFAEFTENSLRLSECVAEPVRSRKTPSYSEQFKHLYHSCRSSFKRTTKLLHQNTISVS